MKPAQCGEDLETIDKTPPARTDPLLAEAQATLTWLVEQIFPRLAPGHTPAAWLAGTVREIVSEAPEARQTATEHAPEWPSCREMQLLGLQERVLEDAARAGNRLLIRGSVVARGSQSLLILGDSAHERLALALSALDFTPVSIGLAAFEAGHSAPISLPLLFALDDDARAALADFSGSAEPHLRRRTAALFQLEEAAPAPEITHLLFPETRCGLPPVVRPISPAAARSRLFDALLVAPEDPPAFAAVAGLVRHTRAVAVSMGSVLAALDPLARLLPRWQAGRATTRCLPE